MAQFQILYSPSTDEWRPITSHFCLLPGDQSNLWPTFGDAEAARKRIDLHFPGIPFRVALADNENGDVDWQTRERLRFADGTYTRVPWHDETWYQALHEDHFCHVSTEQAGKIAFTENSAKGMADRQLVMSPGRYLRRFFSDHLDNNAIEGWCARLSVQLQEDTLKITQDADEIEDVYVGGPCSCMAHPADDFESLCHPVRVYAGPDTALAYIGSREDARARSIVWPERKVYTTIYGDVSRLKLLLENAGYVEGGLNGARLKRICDDGCFVVPYIDGGGDLADNGEYLVVGQGSISAESTTGLGVVPWYCPRCENQTRAYETVHFADGSSEQWCENCYNNSTTFCEHNERLYAEDEDFIFVHGRSTGHTVLEDAAEDFGAVYLEDRCEWWMRSCCRACDGTGEIFHSDDLYEHQGEWLCADCLPGALDDEDTLQANAHVLAYRGFLDSDATSRYALDQLSGDGFNAAGAGFLPPCSEQANSEGRHLSSSSDRADGIPGDAWPGPTVTAQVTARTPHHSSSAGA